MITDDDLIAIIRRSLRGRQNAFKRSLRKDAQAALNGNELCRQHVEKMHRDGKTGDERDE